MADETETAAYLASKVWMYHPTHGGRLFTVAECGKLSKDWKDSPAAFEKKGSRVEVETIPDSVRYSEEYRAVVLGIANLDTENEAHFNKDGSPNIESLEAVSGVANISAELRDAAWKEFLDEA